MSSVENNKQGPIFIGGLGRSGKTYMRMMLAAHPHFAISRRTNMWTFYYGRFGKLSKPHNLERCLQAMMQRKMIRALAPDLDRIRDAFQQGPQTYGRLFALFHIQFAEQIGKPRWGDQTGMVERQADHIFAAYPNAKMIQMIRDPRDRFHALVTRDPQYRDKLGLATASWLYSEAYARHNQQKFPQQYKVVRYESMVLQPEATMRDVCHFLNEAYTPALITMSEEPRFAQLAADHCPLSATYIGRFRKGLSHEEIAFIQAHAQKHMQPWGYQVEPIAFANGEKPRFYLSAWLPHMIQMLSWRARHTLDVHFAERAKDRLQLTGQIVGSAAH